MAVLPLTYMGDEVLRRKAQTIETLDDELRELAINMLETMYTNHGVGLAAPQVDVSKRLIVFDNSVDEYGTDQTILFNPEILEKEGSCKGEEGCLSIPELKDNVMRAEWIKVRGVDINGNEVEFEAEDFPARIIQHEVDHLEGILFVDRLGSLKRNLLMSKWKKIREHLDAEESLA